MRSWGQAAHPACSSSLILRVGARGGRGAEGCLRSLLSAITLQVIISSLRHRDNGKSAIPLHFNDLCIHKCLSAVALKVSR